MWRQLTPGLRLTLFMTLVFGIGYPLAVTGICQLAFPRQANGSLIHTGGGVAGSDLIGQAFTRPEYFHGRPSAGGYDATASGGSNLGPTNKKLIDRVQTAAAQFRADNPQFSGPIPADLLTTSASGLDPHLSPASAAAQAARVAQARGAAPQQVSALIAQLTEAPTFGLLGEPRVNTLRLNLALDARFPLKRPAAAGQPQ